MTARHRTVATVLAALLAVVGALPATAASSAPPVAPDRYLVGGCQISFEWGWPKPVGSSHRPCVGVTDVRRDSRGDLEVHLTQEQSAAAIRLMAQSDTQLAERGIVAGATGGRDTITIRLYDDLRSERVNLNTSSGRSRVTRTNVWVGWTKESGRGGSAEARDISPGHDALGGHRDRSATSHDTVPGGCVIRFPSAGAQVHANQSHRCIGVRSVRITWNGRLEVTASDEQRGAVVNVQGDPDETLTARGLATGVSVSASQMLFTFYDSRLDRRLDLTNPEDRRRVSGQWANLWLSWTKTTARPGSPNATTARARDKYGPYRDGSVEHQDIVQTGCTVRFARVTAEPGLDGNWVRLCTGARRASVNDAGEVVVDNAGNAIVSTTTVSSRSLSDYGVRAGLNGGSGTSRYRMYSMRLGRTLDLRQESDRRILQRTGSALLTGWSHWEG